MTERGRRDPNAKVAHIDACLDEESQYRRTAGFERYELVHRALPHLALDEVDIGLDLLGKRLGSPLMVAPMTGGVERGRDINRTLARAAQRYGLAMGLGSVRIALEDRSKLELFRVRDVAPDVLLFANVGGANLGRTIGADDCLEAVRAVDADHLLVHLNPLQEAIQGGDTDFRNTLDEISRLVEALGAHGVTVGVREVGFGLSAEVARELIDAGVALLDCGGAGGTSWARVEGMCAEDERRRVLAETFSEWGIPTAESVRQVRAVSDHVHIIASGGLRSGLDLAKAIRLGADVGAMARPFLQAAVRGFEAVCELVERVHDELRLAMFATGSRDLEALKAVPLQERRQ